MNFPQVVDMTRKRKSFQKPCHAYFGCPAALPIYSVCQIPTYIKSKEYKEEGPCAQKWGRMLVFVICGFIKDFLPTSYFILQIYDAKSYKMRHGMSLYLNFSVRCS